MKIIKLLCLFLLVVAVVKQIGYVRGLETGLVATNGAQLEMSSLKNKHRKNRFSQGMKLRFNNEDVSNKMNQFQNNEPYTPNSNFDSSSQKMNPKIESSGNNLSQTTSSDIPDKPIYFQGWMKYLKFKESGDKSQSDKHRQFFKNDLFTLQEKTHKPKYDNSSKSVLIPSQLHFYAVLYKSSFNLFSSKDDSYSRTVDVLNIDDIKPIPESDNFLGGVRDFGTFSEGSCFRVLTREPLESFVMTESYIIPKSGIDRKWVFCLDTEETKIKLMNLLIKLKLKKQHSLGVYLEVYKKGEVEEKKEALNDLSATINVNQNLKSEDGYWIVLQDWTQCTLKCGGGLQYQQLMCIPPKQNGKPCQGQAVRTRPCNNQPCPQAKVSNEQVNNFLNKNENKSKEPEELAPIIKVMAISKRLNRYDKCKLKEGDALMVKKDESTKKFSALPKIPVRILLNDKTFSVYQDDDLKNLITSFLIKTTVLSRVIDSPRCFILSTPSNEKLQLCQLESEKNDWVEEWDYDFNLFKHQCYSPRTKSTISIESEKETKEVFLKQVQQVKVDLVKQMTQNLKKKIEETEEVVLQKKVESAKATSFRALEKEVKLEQMLEQEEESKESQETEEIQMKIEREEKKNECLIKAIKEKELEDQFNISKSHAEDEVQKIAFETKKRLTEKRLEIKRKIVEMRRRQGKVSCKKRKKKKGARK